MYQGQEITLAGSVRRGLARRLAGAAALSVAGLLPSPARASMLPMHDELAWPGPLSGVFHQVFDGVEPRSGKVLAYAANFLASNPDGAAASVVVLRDSAVVIALGSDMWEKYKIGESLKFIDPETGAAAVKNPFLHPKPGVLPSDKWAIDRLIADGVVVGACSVALAGNSRALAHHAGVGADEARREWEANLVPGVTLLPSGVWGVNRAQRAGCSYCFGT